MTLVPGSDPYGPDRGPFFWAWVNWRRTAAAWARTNALFRAPQSWVWAVWPRPPGI